ncbi:MAG TPA: hypothetical protein PKE69_18655 [Pyrinomonadaceae bacterium]|nr:hypothetical protein [Pyrinomonadaceae bacterium]
MKFKLVVLLVIGLGLSIGANAQKLFKGVDWVKTVEAAKSGNMIVDKESLARVEAAYAEDESTDKENSLCGGRITGSWYMTVSGATPAETFYAYQTFGADGTFVEN